MKLNTKLILFLQHILNQINQKFISFKIYFTTGIFFLFLGFLIGNLFGSFLAIFEKLIIWPGFITIVLVLFIELVNFLMYRNSLLTKNLYNSPMLKLKYKFLKIVSSINLTFKRYFFHNKKIIFSKALKRNFEASLKFLFSCVANQNNKKLQTNFYVKILNLFKIGILLGFFIDAFKVGS